MEKQINVYREETHELLAELESSILELEESPGDEELIDRAFRAMHTIKGSGGMFGFENISDFTHHIETVFDLVRDGKVIVDKRLVDLTLAACDQIKRMVNKKEIDPEKIDELMDAFIRMIPCEKLPDQAPVVAVAEETGEGLDTVSYRIRFHPHESIFESGANPLLLLDELRELGECRIIAQTQKVPNLESLNPESCYLYWDVILTTAHNINAIKDVFIFVEDQCELTIDVIDEESEIEEEADYKKQRLGQILIDRGDVNVQELNTALGSQKRVGQLLVETKAVTPDAIESALAEQQHIKRVRRVRYEAVAASSIRVAAEKLDHLVDLVGELVTVQARLTQKAAIREDAELLSIAEEVERLTGDLRENTMGIRMLPIGATFSKFKRVVRDLSAELGKEVVLVTEGGETELDKTVIERLGDPLVHIIRNSVDHGIETPELRIQAGKPAQGTIRLSAEHSGALVLISISDDGKGLDTEAIRSKAVEKGLIQPDADKSDSDIFAGPVKTGNHHCLCTDPQRPFGQLVRLPPVQFIIIKVYHRQFAVNRGVRFNPLNVVYITASQRKHTL